MIRNFQKPRSWAAQHGVSLIELLVSMAIGLIISLAAASAYLGTRSTASAQEETSRLNEYGNLALEMIGRELQMAGYYPVYDSAVSTSKGSFDADLKAGVAYDQGIFGCTGARFDPTKGACEASAADDPDSVVMNYFSSVELTGNFSNGFDCLRQDARKDPANTGRAPALPVLVSSRFGLSNLEEVKAPSGATVKTRSFACNGNGKTSEDAIYQPIFQGFEDMVMRYGVHAGTGSQTPQRFYSATEVNALPTVNDLTGWQRVTSVRVCLLGRTLENTRLKDTGKARSYRNCRGANVAYTTSDGSNYKTFERTFAVRNNITGNY